VPIGGSPRHYVRAFAESRRQARRRHNPLDPAGPIAGALYADPIHAMDIGAAGGVAAHWRDYLPVMEVDCFEPDAAECASLQRASAPNVHWFPVAVAGSSGRRPFYVLNRATGSSLYPPNDPVILEYSGRSYAGVRKVIDVDCVALNDFLVEYRRPAPMLMKLDTQGTELEILSSLTTEQMSTLLCVELEVEFLELYQDQPTFADVHAFMVGRGFRLLDLRTHRSYRNAQDQPFHYLRKYLNTAAGSAALSAELVAGDALYFRAGVLERASDTAAHLIPALCILRLYGYYDLAFWLIDKARNDKSISPSEAKDLVRDIAAGAPRPKLSQRAGVAGAATRRILWAFGYDDHEVFWTRRKWPNQ
jgi:FkbM family methyltransferase